MFFKGEVLTKELAMSIISSTMWNLGAQISIQEHHYPLHFLITMEENNGCEALWYQQTEVMLHLGSSVLEINNE